MNQALIDNDIFFKIFSYGILEEILVTKPYGADEFYITGAALFMIKKKIERNPPQRGIGVAISELNNLTSLITVLEPVQEEIYLAAELEFFANQKNLEFDGGESLLCAILLIRSWRIILTGDKRAILAAAKIIEQDKYSSMSKCFICIEQVVRWALNHLEYDYIRSSICSEHMVDKALTICFACTSNAIEKELINDGLHSYICSLKSNAPGTLFEYD